MDPSPPRRTLLIVEDDPDAASSLARILQFRGYETDHAPTIADALSRGDWTRFLAVILDRRLPDGLVDEYLPHFRERDPDIAIVIATGFSDLQGTIAALREGVEDYLIKPVNPDLLFARIERIAEKRATKLELKRLEREVIAAAEEEKHRIAREIHDGLSSKLSGIAMLCRALDRSLEHSHVSQIALNLQQIESLIREAIVEARALSRGLCSIGSEPGDLRKALEELAQNATAIPRLTCKWLCAQDLAIIDPVAASHLYRIAQEAVHNAIKHSGGSSIHLEFLETPASFDLRIADDGSGFTPGSPVQRGLGLHSMDYRARAIGGTLSIQPGPNGGTLVLCSLPKTLSSTAPLIAHPGAARA